MNPLILTHHDDVPTHAVQYRLRGRDWVFGTPFSQERGEVGSLDTVIKHIARLKRRAYSRGRGIEYRAVSVRIEPIS